MFFFFFKQKTAYEMRISDWSSDVCSSDLGIFPKLMETRGEELGELARKGALSRSFAKPAEIGAAAIYLASAQAARSEELRVGKECVSRCRSRWSTHH